MALRDQPYLPLYVQDFLTDEKLIECSPEATGIYIRLMCIMHKSQEYGTILLQQKDKQTEKQILNFATKLAKHLPWEITIIEKGIKELTEEGVLKIEGDKLLQPRMVQDNQISSIRSEAGKKGGYYKHLAIAKPVANGVANTENENENENEIDNEVKSEEKSGIEEERSEIFKVFGKAYPGSKRSFKTEYENFRKKHKDWKEVLPLLSERLAYQVRAREKRKLAGGFVPEWKNLKTWINQRCWEEIISMEIPNSKAMLPKTYEEMLRMAEKDPEVFKRYKPVKREGERKSVYYPIEQL